VRRVPAQHHDGELDLVLRALALRVGGRPELEVLQAVVGAVAVDVMDHLVGFQWSPEVAGHDEAMLGHLALTA
jgi:hypothetical protein